ncbi:Glutathione S-transferase theta-2-like [Oopsacas minuta]|uniref:Glutathione S-transferase theta-2-like n=1 Tax=Oopsacas minuta TaxID=111878 RepID=A0AAV7KIJ5_9METZ|nr:Glutathione S-transferase theta-2-like [Oopsacas minuta]
MSELKLFCDLVSQPCRAIVLLLEINNIPHQREVISLLKGEHRKHEELLAANPNKMLPVIKDGTFVIYESATILRYLCSSRDLPDHWYPKDLKKRVLVDQFFDWFPTNLRKGASGWFLNEVLLKKPSTDPLIEQSKETLRKALTIFNDFTLRDSKFIAGEEISVADIQAVCELTQHWAIGINIYTGYANVERWIADCTKELQPHFNNVYVEIYKMRDLGVLGTGIQPLNYTPKFNN